jgi:hypothetical protein
MKFQRKEDPEMLGQYSATRNGARLGVGGIACAPVLQQKARLHHFPQGQVERR